MSDENDLLDLRRDIDDAIELLKRAEQAAGTLACLSEDKPEIVWEDMAALANRLYVINRAVEGLIPPGVASAFKQAEETLDEWADKADGQSY